MIAAYVFRSEPGLLDHATPVADASSWMPEYGGYFWLDNRRLLAFRPAGMSVQAVRVPAGGSSAVALPELSGALQRGGGVSVATWRLSRDGTRLLWNSVANGGWSLTDVATGVTTRQRAGSGNMALWSPGSRTWLDIRPPRAQARTVSVAEIGLDGREMGRPGGDMHSQSGWAIGVTPRRTIVFFDPARLSQGTSPQCQWSEETIGASPRLVSHGLTALPEYASGITEAELSPDGTRIALLVQSDYESPLDRLLARFFHIPSKPRVKARLWVVRTDGSGKALVGAEADGIPFGVMWRTDGASISLVDHGKLYTIPAPK
ncbi:MAG TPA: hypothetical protein VKT77_10510 [Chthonomonadaceae bacterium]|nr:hypothetical protein [Chthonomonadaceae bacterium]